MNKFLLYVNEVLESLDIPKINSTAKKIKSSSRYRSNNIHSEEK